MVSARLGVWGVVVMIAASVLSGTAWAATPAIVKGRMANGTSGAALPGGLVITVIQIGPQGDEVARKQTGVGNDQTFSVDGFDLDQGASFAVSADYLGVSYSRVVDVSGENPAPGGEVSADLLVYETTDDESVLSISSDVLTIVGGKDKPFEVIQLQRVLNSSDRTFIGRSTADPKQVLRLPLPSGAFEVVPLEGISVEQLSTISGGIVNGVPVVPGDRSASFIYKVRAPGEWNLSRQFFYPTKQVDILVGSGLRLESSRFKFQEGVTLEERRYGRYRAGPFDAGDVLQANIGIPGGLPGPGLLWGLAAGLILLAILGGGTLAVRRRSRAPAARHEVPAFTSDERRRTLVEQIAVLDEEFEQGIIARDDYAAKRQSLKEQLGSSTDVPAV